MEHAFVVETETWGSAGQMLDVLTLRDGKIVVIMETRLAVYEDMDAFGAAAPHAIVTL